MKRALAAAAVIGAALAGAARPAVRAAARAPESQEPETTRSVWEGVFTEEQSKRGQALYLEKCASCHSDNLMGGESATALAGDVFESSWNGLTAGDLFERTRISMPQDKPGSLARQQVADILAFIFDANKFPRGDKELDKSLPALKSIRLVMPKPN